MSLKDKIKGAWKRVSDLDDDSAKVHTSENERIPYEDISKQLKALMKKKVDVVGRKILIPSYYIVQLSEQDREQRREVEDVLCQELKEELYTEMRKINPEQLKGDLLIEVGTDNELSKGQFRIDYRMKKPEAGSQQERPAQNQPDPQPASFLEQEQDLKDTIIERPTVHDADDMPTVIQAPKSESPKIKILVDEGQSQKEHEFGKDKITIGRASHDDITLESEDFSISRGHFKIELREGEYYIFPSGVNGTSLNGEELELQVEAKVNPGDEIKVSGYTLKILT